MTWPHPDWSRASTTAKGRTDGDRRLRDVVAKAVRTRLTERLRLEPIGPDDAERLWLLHQDEGIAKWFDGPWSEERAAEKAVSCGIGWEDDGVEKWMAYDRANSGLVGRGGMSVVQLEGRRQLEAGWTLRSQMWGRGYATEIGRASLEFAFNELDMAEAVAFTEPHNVRSRAVMERLGMRFARDIVHHDRPMVLYVAFADSARAPSNGPVALH